MDVARLLDNLRQPAALLDRDRRLRHANAAFRAVFGDEPVFLASLPSVPFRDHRIELGRRILICDAREIEEGILLSLEDRTGTDELTKHLRYQRLLQQSLGHASYSLGPDFRFLAFNPAAERLLGYEAREVLNRLTEEIIRFAGESPRDSARSSLREGSSITTEARVIRKDGSEIDVLFAATPVSDDDGRIIGYTVLMNDIGLRKQLERELREQADALEEANRELESFSLSLSQDLRSPVRAIDRFTRIILDSYGDKMAVEEQELFGHVRRNAERMGRLIDELLELSRLGRRPVEHEKVDMNALVAIALDGAADPSRCIELHVGPLPEATGDPVLLQQVWVSLIENALKHTCQREKAVITIGGERRGDENVYWVEDNGVGFDTKDVFDRLHSSLDSEGPGVGLARVRRIVRRHDGRVVAEGAADEGAKLTFSLPAVVTAR